MPQPQWRRAAARRDRQGAHAATRLILADEPVASLDPRLAGNILGLLRDIAREEQIPVIVSLHVVGLAHRYADRVLGLHSGELVFAGPATNITEKEVHQIYGTDTELLEN